MVACVYQFLTTTFCLFYNITNHCLVRQLLLQQVLCLLHSTPHNKYRKVSVSRRHISHVKFSYASVVSQLTLSHYERVFCMLLSRGVAARRAFDKVVSHVISQQVRDFVKRPRDADELFAGSQSVYSFSWDQHNPTEDLSTNSSGCSYLSNAKDLSSSSVSTPIY